MRARALAALLLLTPHPAAAQATPDQLKVTEQQLDEARMRERELNEQTGRLEGELKTLQKELIRLSAAVQKNERGLLDAEDKLKILGVQLEEKTVTLEDRKTRLAAMIRAAIRLSHTPPEAAVMLPGDFDRTVRGARVLSTLTRTIRSEAESIAVQVEELEALKARVEENRAKFTADQQALKAQREELAARIGERKGLAAQLWREQGDARQKVADLSKQSKDLKDLLAGLEQARQQQEKERQEKEKKESAKARTAAKAPPGGKLRSFARARGSLSLPVSGRVERRWGQAVGRNETSKGLLIRTREAAAVTAPYDAEVVFVGPFLAYGNMVILRHADGFHTLLAGLAGIDVAVGQFLLEGEPIGAMGKNPRGTELYIELREHNQPIDPSGWLTALR